MARFNRSVPATGDNGNDGRIDVAVYRDGDTVQLSCYVRHAELYLYVRAEEAVALSETLRDAAMLVEQQQAQEALING
tara:strand:+ start:1462 stop:1695 length:234 start_codon:yes stop_codon:yes gene_type:complete